MRCLRYGPRNCRCPALYAVWHGRKQVKNALRLTCIEVGSGPRGATEPTIRDYPFLVEDAQGPKAVFSFFAVFAEVRVDPEFGLVRLSRFVGTYDAGRIINPKTAQPGDLGRGASPARAI